MLVHVLSAGMRECQLRNYLLQSVQSAVLGSMFLNKIDLRGPWALRMVPPLGRRPWVV